MSNCVGCQPGPSCGACDCGGNCGCGEYTTTDYCHAVSTKDACRFPPPEAVPMVSRWKDWFQASEDHTVKVNSQETGTVVALRERDKMLEVQLADERTLLFPMRTTEAV